MKQAKIFMVGNLAGTLTEDENGYTFVYDETYLDNKNTEPISPTLPLTDEPFFNRNVQRKYLKQPSLPYFLTQQPI